MSLPSQAPRAAATGRTHVRTHRRRGFRLPRLVIVGFVVVVCVGTAWWLTRGDKPRTGNPMGPDAASAGDQTLVPDPFERDDSALRTKGSTPTVARRGTPTNQPASQGRQDPPVTISQGGSDAGAGETGATPGRALNIDQPRTLGESLDGASESATEDPAPAKPAPPSGALQRAVAAAEQRLAANDPVAARSVLNQALRDGSLGEDQRSQIRARLTEINQQLIFSATVVPGDPLTGTYEIAGGDRLSTLPGKLGLAVDWRLLQRINGIADPNKIRLGQKLKIVRGPFNAVVHKDAYRLDLFAGPPEDERDWVYVRSFQVGLGEGDSTPTGAFVVKRDSKLVDPNWVNPRTGERFDHTDPKNPIGERWIGLEGLGADASKTGYGIHGTIDPDSIGQQRSMGCVRMRDDDVEMVYELLVEGISRVRIAD